MDIVQQRTSASGVLRLANWHVAAFHARLSPVGSTSNNAANGFQKVVP